MRKFFRKLVLFFSGKCIHADECKYYRKKDYTCENGGYEYCGVWREWEKRGDARRGIDKGK